MVSFSKPLQIDDFVDELSFADNFDLALVCGRHRFPPFIGMLCSRKIDVPKTKVWGLLADFAWRRTDEKPKKYQAKIHEEIPKCQTEERALVFIIRTYFYVHTLSKSILYVRMYLYILMYIPK